MSIIDGPEDNILLIITLLRAIGIFLIIYAIIDIFFDFNIIDYVQSIM